jgi:predicted amino acid racemase
MAFVSIDLHAIKHNADFFARAAERNECALTAVTKFCGSHPGIVQALSSWGIKSIADSNMVNLASARLSASALPGIDKSLIKTRLSDIKAFSELGPEDRPDRVYVSDPAILEAIRALPQARRPEVVLIVELGDLKEGMYPDRIMAFIEDFIDLDIIGVSANFACLSGTMPEIGSIKTLASLAEAIRKRKGLERPFASAGGTVIYDFLERGELAGLVTEVRIGEGLFFGRDSSGDRALPGLRDDAFTLSGEILEIREKMVTPRVSTGHSALGGTMPEARTGLRTRAILDFGALAAALPDLRALDPGAGLAGQTYDFTATDITESLVEYRTGGFMDFRVQYSGASRAFLNGYLAKTIVGI